jgi:uncharacterized membrane protein
MITDSKAPGTSKRRKLRILLRKHMISGVLIVVPLGITFFVLEFIYVFTAGHLSSFIKEGLQYSSDYTAPIIACFLLFALVYLAGLAANVFLGRKAIALGEDIIQRIPFVKSIYSASKQVVQALVFQTEGGEPKTAAIIEFPYKGMKCLGFVLGKVNFADGRTFYRVYIPTTPNITVGLLQFVAPEDVYRCEFTIDEAIKIIVSGGILGPPQMTLTAATESPIESPTTEDLEEV